MQQPALARREVCGSLRFQREGLFHKEKYYYEIVHKIGSWGASVVGNEVIFSKEIRDWPFEEFSRKSNINWPNKYAIFVPRRNCWQRQVTFSKRNSIPEFSRKSISMELTSMPFLSYVFTINPVRLSCKEMPPTTSSRKSTSTSKQTSRHKHSSGGAYDTSRRRATLDIGPAGEIWKQDTPCMYWGAARLADFGSACRKSWN